MAHEGYIYLWRSILHSDFYATPNTCHLAVHLMLTAAWKDHHILVGGKRLLLQRGQAYTGRRKLRKETGLTEREIRTSLRHLENVGFLTRTPTNKGSAITICKYNSYQNIIIHSDPQTDQQPTSNRPHRSKGRKGRQERKKESPC